MSSPPIGSVLLLRDGSYVQLLFVDAPRARLLVRHRDNATRWARNGSVAVHPNLVKISHERWKPRNWPAGQWKPRHLATSRWMPLLDALHSVIVQIGANDHAAAHGALSHVHDDPGPLAVKLGWSKAILVEPIASTFSVLQQRYRNVTDGRVSLLRAAVCGPSCSMRSRAMWHVDLDNATGTYGSNVSDGRCAKLAGEAPWLREISSLSKGHILKHSSGFRSSADACEKCSHALGRRLPTNCMQRLLAENLVSTEVECLCLPELLLRGPWPGFAVTLLLVDAEGADADVLEQYPFAELPPARVQFEPMHLTNAAWDRSVSLLRRLGYENVAGPWQTAFASTWHHLNSTEVYKRH